MARCATYRLRKGKDEVTVNQSAYHADLNRWEGWKRIGETHAEGEVAVGTTAPEAAPEPEPQAEAKATAEGPIKTK